MTAIDAIPNSSGAANPWTQGSLETLPLAFDFTPNLGEETIVSAVVTLIELTTGLAHPWCLAGSPSIVGKVVSQVVTLLVSSSNYRLTVQVATSGTKSWEMTLLITCPY